MAVISITLGDAPQGTTGTSNHQKVVLGETVVAINFLYLKSSDNKYWKAIDTTQEAAKATVIAVQDGDADDSISVINIAEGGLLEVANATFTAGEMYAVASTAGLIEFVTDKTTGEFLRVVGYAFSTTVLWLLPGFDTSDTVA